MGEKRRSDRRDWKQLLREVLDNRPADLTLDQLVEHTNQTGQSLPEQVGWEDLNPKSTYQNWLKRGRSSVRGPRKPIQLLVLASESGASEQEAEELLYSATGMNFDSFPEAQLAVRQLRWREEIEPSGRERGRAIEPIVEVEPDYSSDRSTAIVPLPSSDVVPTSTPRPRRRLVAAAVATVLAGMALTGLAVGFGNDQAPKSEVANQVAEVTLVADDVASPSTEAVEIDGVAVPAEEQICDINLAEMHYGQDFDVLHAPDGCPSITIQNQYAIEDYEGDIGPWDETTSECWGSLNVLTLWLGFEEPTQGWLPLINFQEGRQAWFPGRNSNAVFDLLAEPDPASPTVGSFTYTELDNRPTALRFELPAVLEARYTSDQGDHPLGGCWHGLDDERFLGLQFFYGAAR